MQDIPLPHPQAHIPTGGQIWRESGRSHCLRLFLLPWYIFFCSTYKASVLALVAHSPPTEAVFISWLSICLILEVNVRRGLKKKAPHLGNKEFLSVEWQNWGLSILKVKTCLYMTLKDGCYMVISLFHWFSHFICLYTHTVNFTVHLLNSGHALIFVDQVVKRKFLFSWILYLWKACHYKIMFHVNLRLCHEQMFHDIVFPISEPSTQPPMLWVIWPKS